MAKNKRRNALSADSAAYSVLSSEARSMLRAIAESAGRDKSKPVLVEVTPGRFVEVKLSDKWQKFGAASSENVERAKNIVDLAEAAFEAERAAKH
jgi:hypothetical protein